LDGLVFERTSEPSWLVFGVNHGHGLWFAADRETAGCGLFFWAFACACAMARELSFAEAFYKINSHSRRECRRCDTTFALTSGGGTLRTHYKRNHVAVVLPNSRDAKRARVEAVEDVDMTMSVGSSAAAAAAAGGEAVAVSSESVRSDSTRRSTVQLTLNHSFSSSVNASLPEAIALFFATNHIPYNVADSASFGTMCAAVRNSTLPFSSLPQRKAVATAVTALATRLRSAVLARITGGTAPVTIAIDGWTNVRHTKVTNVLLLSGGVAYYWCSISNNYAANTAVWLESVLTPVLQELVTLGVRFAALVADNEAVNEALWKRLLDPFPFLLRIPCAAHTIQLVVQQVMQIRRFAATLATVSEVLSHFERNKASRMRLRTVQIGEQREYSLIKPCDTRWNSTLRACERLQKLRAFINVVLPQSEEFWKELAALCAYLRPFQEATDIIQRDSATLYNVYQQFHALLAHIDRSESSGDFNATLSSHARRLLKQRWNKQVNQPATIAVALLSLDTDTSAVDAAVVDEAKAFIIEFGVSYLLFFKLSTAEPAALNGALTRQVAQLCGRRDGFLRIAQQIAACKHGDAAFDPLDVWDLYSVELALVAKALLTITASEAAVERSFSAQDAVHTKKRNRLLDARVQNEMFVKFNTRALERQPTLSLSDRAANESDILLSADLDNITAVAVHSDSDNDSDSSRASTPAVQEEEKEPDVGNAAAAAAVRRSQSDIDGAMHSFLSSYIADHGITLANVKQRTTRDGRNALEAALLDHGGGCYTTDDAIKAIRALLEEQH
jgi:hypothetical protein